jgi:hypothetical protein
MPAPVAGIHVFTNVQQRKSLIAGTTLTMTGGVPVGVRAYDDNILIHPLTRYFVPTSPVGER